MPIVTVNLLNGRTPDQITTMIGEISKAISTSLDAPIETVRVIVNEMEDHQYGIAGLPAREAIAARNASAGEGADS